MHKLLLIDDDDKLAGPLAEYFSRFELSLENITNPIQGIARLQQAHFDLVILDVMLPEIDGFETCRRIRQFSSIPVIMLTARGDVMDRVVGLELGADDYLPKPFEPRELVARIQNVFKRSEVNRQDAVLELGDLTIDLKRKQVMLQDIEIELTATDFALLELLIQQQGRVLSRDQIMQELRGIDADFFSRAIDVSISRLRQKLQRPDLIRTVRGSGYQWVNR
ncbi:MAG: two-component system OmpR family response regulator [Planctomycetota bacterium]|jgi:two-component system OmpR family response regulator